MISGQQMSWMVEDGMFHACPASAQGVCEFVYGRREGLTISRILPVFVVGGDRKGCQVPEQIWEASTSSSVLDGGCGEDGSGQEGSGVLALVGKQARCGTLR